jgi:hypothetical protein
LTYDELYEWLEDEGLDYDYDEALQNWHGRTPLTNIISRDDYNNHFNLDENEEEESAPAAPITAPEPEPEPVFFYEAFDYAPLETLEILINSLFDE